MVSWVIFTVISQDINLVGKIITTDMKKPLHTFAEAPAMGKKIIQNHCYRSPPKNTQSKTI